MSAVIDSLQHIGEMTTKIAADRDAHNHRAWLLHRAALLAMKAVSFDLAREILQKAHDADTTEQARIMGIAGHKEDFAI